jgi:hypothetical protein
MTRTDDERHHVVVTPQAQLAAVLEAEHIARHATAIVSPRQVHALVAYYVILLVVAVALLVYMIVNQTAIVPPLLVRMGFVASGAMVGSVLYQIRMLFRYYIPDKDTEKKFDSRWLAKYVSGPWEAIALALVVLSLLEVGGAAFGGAQFDMTRSPTFGAFGIGALVGFGIREVVGWLGNLARTTFPTGDRKSP